MSFGTDGRRLEVVDFGKRQASRIYRRHRRQLRGLVRIVELQAAVAFFEDFACEVTMET
jgi:Mn-dependent DtxR family transcriptional regulator